MTKTNDDTLIFTPDFQILVGEIKKIRLLPASISTFGDKHHPRMLINDSCIIDAYEALSVIDQLLDCGFYTQSQHEQAKGYMQSLIDDTQG